jgi:hypothetical protein
MNNYSWEYIQNHQKETKRLLGINYEQLQELVRGCLKSLYLALWLKLIFSTLDESFLSR